MRHPLPNTADKISVPQDLRPAAGFFQMRKNLRNSARSALSKRVLRLTTEFVPAFANSNPVKLPLAAPNREIRRRSVSQPRTGRMTSEKYCGSGMQSAHDCADLSAQNWSKNSEALLRRDGLCKGGRSRGAGARVVIDKNPA